tara:strand:- start:94 stop:420 length:327 start_codon:yes stop_codon:yes gene_type:complete
MYLGEFRNRVALQTLSQSTDGAGGYTSSYSTATTVWSKVEATSGSESMFGDQVRATQGYKFTIRYYSALTSAYRLSYRSKLFNITSIKIIDEGKNRYQEIMATEGVAT